MRRPRRLAIFALVIAAISAYRARALAASEEALRTTERASERPTTSG